MMKTKKLLFALLSASATLSIAQDFTHQGVVIGNSGNGPQTNFSFLNADSETITFQEEVSPSYVQYCLTDNQFAYLAATDSVYKYNIATETLVSSANFTPTSTSNLLISGDYLFVGNQFGTDTAHMEVFDKNTMDQVSLLTDVNYPVVDMVEAGGKLYVLQNIKHTVELFPGYALDSLGFITVINIADLSLEAQVNFDAAQTHNFEKVFVYDNKLTIFGSHEMGAVSHHVYTYDITSEAKTYNTFDYPINLTYGNQSSQKGSKAYFKFNGGIGLYDLEGDSVLNASVVSEAPTSFAVDWVNEEIYFAKGNYSSEAYGNIYNFSGDSIGNFIPGNGYAPEAIAVVSSLNPVANIDLGRLKIYGQYDISAFDYVSGQSPQVTVDLLVNDIEAVPSTVEILTQGSQGTSTILTTATTASLVYTPADYTDGTVIDEITYRVGNAFGEFDTTKVTIDWLEINATLVNFDELDLGSDGYINGSDQKGGFLSSEYTESNRGAYFKNSFNPTWSSWSGIAASSLTDNTTAGYTNQFSTYVGSAASGDNFAITSGTQVEFEISSLYGIKSLDISNSTYAALSMKNGDGFAKQFGGLTGSDEDWFKVMIYGTDYNDVVIDSVEYYLADYRFADSTQDYILNTWETIDLTSTGLYNTPVKTLKFVLSSSDNSMWGMNTPASFCLDNINCTQFISVSDVVPTDMVAYPNPTQGIFNIHTTTQNSKIISIYNVTGQMVHSVQTSEANVSVDLSAYTNGLYYVKLKGSDLNQTFQIVKK